MIIIPLKFIEKFLLFSKSCYDLIKYGNYTSVTNNCNDRIKSVYLTFLLKIFTICSNYSYFKNLILKWTIQ